MAELLELVRDESSPDSTFVFRGALMTRLRHPGPWWPWVASRSVHPALVAITVANVVVANVVVANVVAAAVA